MTGHQEPGRAGQAPRTKGVFVGLAGRLASGKDVVADHLVAEHGFTKVGMSDPLLTILRTVDPWIPVNAHDLPQQGHSQGHFVRASWLVSQVGYVEAKENPEVRRLLQMIGDDAGRRVHGENVWVEHHRRTIAPQLEQGKNIVLTGVRYPNELQLVRQLHGHAVWVHRPAAPSGVTHASENSLERSDFTLSLDNCGTIDDLKEAADALLLPLLQGQRRGKVWRVARWWR